jgi:hypothetical protein
LDIRAVYGIYERVHKGKAIMTTGTGHAVVDMYHVSGYSVLGVRMFHCAEVPSNEFLVVFNRPGTTFFGKNFIQERVGRFIKHTLLPKYGGSLPMNPRKAYKTSRPLPRELLPVVASLENEVVCPLSVP